VTGVEMFSLGEKKKIEIAVSFAFAFFGFLFGCLR